MAKLLPLCSWVSQVFFFFLFSKWKQLFVWKLKYKPGSSSFPSHSKGQHMVSQPKQLSVGQQPVQCGTKFTLLHFHSPGPEHEHLLYSRWISEALLGRSYPFPPRMQNTEAHSTSQGSRDVTKGTKPRLLMDYPPWAILMHHILIPPKQMLG